MRLIVHIKASSHVDEVTNIIEIIDHNTDTNEERCDG